MLYLASPYSHSDPVVVEKRFEDICRIAGKLMNDGEIVFSPIAHCHVIAMRCELPIHWEFWKRIDEEFIRRSDKVVVAMMPGWKESKGVTAEIAIATELGIPVEYLEV